MTHPSPKQGFTLIEMLLSLALAGLLMTGLSYTLYSFSHAWFNQTEDDAIHVHVDGVTGFLQRMVLEKQNDTESETTEIQANNSAPAGNSLEDWLANPNYIQNGNTIEDVSSGATVATIGETGNVVAIERAQTQTIQRVVADYSLTWDKPPGYSRLDDPLISFSVETLPPFLQSDVRQLGHIACYLYFDDREGLYLLWHSAMEEVEDLDDVHNRRLSPHVTDLQYAYYDAEQDDWEILEEPRQVRANELEMPQYLRLTFVYEEETLVRQIYLPSLTLDVPVY